jgi:hypothetical protein
VMEDRPLIVVVEQEGGDLSSPSRLLQSRFRVVTCPVETVALEYVTESRPAAVLQDASAFYLDPGVAGRWRDACPGTRVLFVDTDGPWALLMDPAGEDIAINPCALDEIASAVDELLSGGAGRKECPNGGMAFLAV